MGARQKSRRSFSTYLLHRKRYWFSTPCFPGEILEFRNAKPQQRAFWKLRAVPTISSRLRQRAIYIGCFDDPAHTNEVARGQILLCLAAQHWSTNSKKRARGIRVLS